MEAQVTQLNKDLGYINTLIEKKNIKMCLKENIKRRGLPVTREEIKENIKAKNNKIKRYQSRIYQYQQNCTFKNNQGKFYRELNCEGRNYETTEVPDKGRKKRALGRYRIA